MEYTSFQSVHWGYALMVGLPAGAELSDSDYSEADEVQAPKRKTPAKARAARLASLLGNGYSGSLQQQQLRGADSAEAAEEERATRDAFWHGFGGTSKVPPLPL